MSESIQLLDHCENNELKYAWSVDIDASGKFLFVPFCDASTRVKLEIFDLTQYWSSSSSTTVSSAAAAASATSETVEKNNTPPLVSFDVKDIQGTLSYCFSGKFHPDPKKKLIAGAGGTSVRVFSWKQENENDDSPNNENFKEILKIDGKRNREYDKQVIDVQFSNNGLFFLTSSSSSLYVWNTEDWSLVHEISNPGSYHNCWIGDDRRIPLVHEKEAAELASSFHILSAPNQLLHRIVKKKNETSSEFTVESVPLSDVSSVDTEIVGNVAAMSYSPQTNIFSMQTNSNTLNIIDTNCCSSPSSWKMLLSENVSRYVHSGFTPDGETLVLCTRTSCLLRFYHRTDSRDSSWKSVFDNDSGDSEKSAFKLHSCNWKKRMMPRNLFAVATSQQGIFACGTDSGVTIHYAKFLCSFWERRKYLLLISEFSKLIHLKQALEMYVVKRNVAKFL